MDILSLLSWGAPREVQTKNGLRVLRKAQPTESFWAAWKSHGDELKAAGISPGRDRETGCWEVCWWSKPSVEQQEARREALESSKATDADVDIPAPAGLAYLGYQKAGILYAQGRKSCLIADEMGLGKTIQAIGLINSLPQDHARRILVVCPASLKLNWRNELRKWLVERRQITVVNGGKFTPPTTETPGVWILNYDILGKHPWVYDGMWDLVIFDESHYLKNPKAQRTKAAFGWKERPGGIPARRRLALTGTPILNRPIELWPLLHAFDPVKWPNFFRFGKRYCAGYQGKWGWDWTGSSNLEELQGILRETLMVRRLKKDVLKELPPKRRQLITLDAAGDLEGFVSRESALSSKHEDELERLRLDVEMLRDGDEEAYRAAVAALRQEVSIAFTEMAGIRHDLAVAKAPACVAWILEALESVDKVVVFAHHHDVVDALMAGLAEFSPVKLTGEMSSEARQTSVERFQSDPACRVFVGNIQAAGVGITLTAASTVIFCELCWTPAGLSQSEDRCHRIGQTESVNVYHLVADGSLDARMAEVLIEKQDVIDRAMDARLADEPVVAPQTTLSLDPEEEARIKAAGKHIHSPKELEILMLAIRDLARMCDGAVARDYSGFNASHTRVGHWLASQIAWTPRQAAYAAKLVRVYHGQVSEAALAVARKHEKKGE